MIIFEMGKLTKPGIFRDRPGGKKFIRVWFLWFAFTWTEYDLHSLCSDIEKGRIGWTMR